MAWDNIWQIAFQWATIVVDSPVIQRAAAHAISIIALLSLFWFSG
jgi:hypothetical protein